MLFPVVPTRSGTQNKAAMPATRKPSRRKTKEIIPRTMPAIPIPLFVASPRDPAFMLIEPSTIATMVPPNQANANSTTKPSAVPLDSAATSNVINTTGDRPRINDHMPSGLRSVVAGLCDQAPYGLGTPMRGAACGMPLGDAHGPGAGEVGHAPVGWASLIAVGAGIGAGTGIGIGIGDAGANDWGFGAGHVGPCGTGAGPGCPHAVDRGIVIGSGATLGGGHSLISSGAGAGSGSGTGARRSSWLSSGAKKLGTALG